MVSGERRARTPRAATQGTLNLTIETAGASRAGACQLLPAGNAAHVGQLVGDALVAVDAGLLAREQEALVGDGGARRLLGDVHRIRAVTVAAFQGVVGLEARPFMQRQLKPVVDEFFAGVDGAEQMAPDLLRGLHLAGDLVGPVMRHMAVRAACAHAGAVGEVDGGFQLLKHVVVHLVTGGAEFFRVGELKRGVEGAPEDDAGDEARHNQYAEPEHRARPPQHAPELECKIPDPDEKTRARFGAIHRAHRRPPGAARLSMVSMSTKSLLTGGLEVLCGTWHSVQKKRRGETEARNWPSRSMKWVIDTIGACESAVRARAWQDRHLLLLRSIW